MFLVVVLKVFNNLYAPYLSNIVNSSQLNHLLQNQTNFENDVSLELVTKQYAVLGGKLKYDRSAIKIPNIDLKSINLTIFYRYEDIYDICKKFQSFFLVKDLGPSFYLRKTHSTTINKQNVVLVLLGIKRFVLSLSSQCLILFTIPCVPRWSNLFRQPLESDKSTQSLEHLG